MWFFGVSVGYIEFIRMEIGNDLGDDALVFVDVADAESRVYLLFGELLGRQVDLFRKHLQGVVQLVEGEELPNHLESNGALLVSWYRIRYFKSV